MINKNLWFIDGLQNAISINQEDKWILNYFNKHAEKIIYEACEWLVCNDDENVYYSLCLNGSENRNISFIIQYCGNDKYWFNVKQDYSDIKEVFDKVLNQFCGEIALL